MNNNNVKIGRNEICYCGSGKKYKHCCMEKINRDWALIITNISTICLIIATIGIFSLSYIDQKIDSLNESINNLKYSFELRRTQSMEILRMHDHAQLLRSHVNLLEQLNTPSSIIKMRADETFNKMLSSIRVAFVTADSIPSKEEYKKWEKIRDIEKLNAIYHHFFETIKAKINKTGTTIGEKTKELESFKKRKSYYQNAIGVINSLGVILIAYASIFKKK